MIIGELSLPKMKGLEIRPGIEILEEPTLVDGELRCLANVCGCLAIIALKITLQKETRSV